MSAEGNLHLDRYSFVPHQQSPIVVTLFVLPPWVTGRDYFTCDVANMKIRCCQSYKQRRMMFAGDSRCGPAPAQQCCKPPPAPPHPKKKRNVYEYIYIYVCVLSRKSFEQPMCLPAWLFCPCDKCAKLSTLINHPFRLPPEYNTSPVGFLVRGLVFLFCFPSTSRPGCP